MIVQKSYIDNNGRLAIPIKVRQKLKLKIGDEVTIKCNDSEFQCRREDKDSVRIIKRGRNIIAAII